MTAVRVTLSLGAGAGVFLFSELTSAECYISLYSSVNCQHYTKRHSSHPGAESKVKLVCIGARVTTLLGSHLATLPVCVLIYTAD